MDVQPVPMTIAFPADRNRRTRFALRVAQGVRVDRGSAGAHHSRGRRGWLNVGRAAWNSLGRGVAVYVPCPAQHRFHDITDRFMGVLVLF